MLQLRDAIGCSAQATLQCMSICRSAACSADLKPAHACTLTRRCMRRTTMCGSGGTCWASTRRWAGLASQQLALMHTRLLASLGMWGHGLICLVPALQCS